MEIWRDVIGFESYYMVSNLGRVRSKERKYPNKLTDGEATKKSTVLKSWLNKGYARVGLSIKGKHYFKAVHRLVAYAFLDKTEDQKVVNHIDGDPLNNKLDNLEWCTQKENILHSLNILKIQPNNSKIVFDSDTGIYYNSALDAFKAINTSVGISMFRLYVRNDAFRFSYV